MGERQRRRARNESLFREVNERIEEIARDFGVTGKIEFICECDRLDCTQRFDMSLDEYEALRSDPTAFAVVPGHQSPDVDYVVSERGNYYIVRKYAGEPARVAAEDAPR
jgi:hypothetical protein